MKDANIFTVSAGLLVHALLTRNFRANASPSSSLRLSSLSRSMKRCDDDIKHSQKVFVSITFDFCHKLRKLEGIGRRCGGNAIDIIRREAVAKSHAQDIEQIENLLGRQRVRPRNENVVRDHACRALL